MTAQTDQPSPQLNQSLDAPDVDINSVGASEKPFPLWLFVAGGLVVILMLAAAAFFVKSSTPFLTPSKKEEIPVAGEPDPTSSTPKLTQAEPAAQTQPQMPDQGIEQLPTVPSALPTTAPQATKQPTGNGPCPTTLLLDVNKKPVLDESGAPIAVDCKGTQVRSRIMPVPTANKNNSGAPVAIATEAIDRYQGEIIIAKQAKGATHTGQSSTGNLPQLPAPPVGATEVLRQLEALQRGQISPIPSPFPTNPILSPATQQSKNGAIQTQGVPSAMLGADKADRTFAKRTIDESMVIPRGTPIDCALTTRLVTEISGFAGCQVTRDVYSANGRVLLIERMSVLDGEYAAVSQAGQRYIHVLWTRLRKPGGITIDIASPSTDGLGGSGVPATVDNRWVERLGGAYLLSFIKDGIAYATAKDASSGSSVAGGLAYQNTIKQSEGMAEKVLNTTINIKPVLYANQGDRVGIYVARDLDFSKVYEVRVR